MRELVRLVEVKVIDHVAVGQRLQRQQVRQVGLVRAGGDDRLPRRNLADGRGHMRLDSGPAIGIVDLRLVQDLEEHPVRVAVGIMRSQLVATAS